MKLIETEWTKYRNNVIPKDASPAQLTESRRAFFAGSWAFYMLMMNNLSEGPDETPKDLDLLNKLDAEMREFTKRVERGLA